MKTKYTSFMSSKSEARAGEKREGCSESFSLDERISGIEAYLDGYRLLEIDDRRRICQWVEEGDAGEEKKELTP